jgi:hypothetical protein
MELLLNIAFRIDRLNIVRKKKDKVENAHKN